MTTGVVDQIIEQLQLFHAVAPSLSQAASRASEGAVCVLCNDPASLSFSAGGRSVAWCPACRQGMALAARLCRIGQLNPRPAAATDGAGRITGFRRWLRAEGLCQLSMLAVAEGVRVPPKGTLASVLEVALAVRCFGLPVARRHDILLTWAGIALASVRNVVVHRLRPDVIALARRLMPTRSAERLPALMRGPFILEIHDEQADAAGRLFGGTVMVAGFRSHNGWMVAGTESSGEAQAAAWQPERGFYYRDGDDAMAVWRGDAARFVVAVGELLDERAPVRVLEQALFMEPEKPGVQRRRLGTIAHVATAAPESSDLATLAEEVPEEKPSAGQALSADDLAALCIEYAQLVQKEAELGVLSHEELARKVELAAGIDASDLETLALSASPEQRTTFIDAYRAALTANLQRHPELLGSLRSIINSKSKAEA